MSNVQKQDTRVISDPLPSLWDTLRRLLPQDTTVIRLAAIVLVLFIGFSLVRPDNFPTLRNMQSMAFQGSEIGILAIAVVITMLTGGIDLSVTATANLTAIMAATVLTTFGTGDIPPEQVSLAVAMAFAVALILGLVCGAFNGFLVAYVGIPPILATLGTLTLFRGIGTVITGGQAVNAIPEFTFVGTGRVAEIIPVPFIIFLGVATLVGILLSSTRYGFEVYMLGTNPVAARFSGINNRRVLLVTYTLSGLLASIAGMIILGRTSAIRIDFGQSYILLSIMIAVLGGVNPMGGSGRILGVVLAVIAIQFLSTGMNMLLFQNSGANFFKEAAWGMLLIVVLLLDYASKRYERRRRRTSER